MKMELKQLVGNIITNEVMEIDIETESTSFNGIVSQLELKEMSTLELADFFPGIQSNYSTQVYDVLSPLGKSVPSLITKHLLIHSYSPKISVMSSEKVDSICKKVVIEKGNKQDVNCFLDLLNYYEQTLSELDSGKVSLSGSPSRLVVKFTKPIHEQLGLQLEKKADGVVELFNVDNYKSVSNEYIKKIDSFIRRQSETSDDTNKLNIDMNNEDIRLLNNSIYSKMLLYGLSSNQVSPLEYFNHPILQLFAISASDEFEDIKRSLIDWREKQSYPNWIDISEILPMFLIVINSDNDEELQNGLRLQEDIKIRLGIKCSIVALKVESQLNQTKKRLYPSNFTPVDNFLQCELESIEILEKNFDSLLNTLNDLIYKDMVPYMERKIKQWNEEVVAPRKSFTGRLFNRKWGSASSSSLPISSEKAKGSSFFSFGGSHHTNTENTEAHTSIKSEPGTPPSIATESSVFYDATSPEMLIRRKADWSFMLRDYKSSYTTYELIKKDFINAKSYLYLASVQEFMIISLLVGSSNKLNPLSADVMRSNANVGGITMKIITDVINPFVESSYYTYLSRYNLKTYTLRLLITIAELYFCLGQSTSTLLRHNISESSNSVGSEIYFIEALKLFKKLIASRILDSSTTGKAMERISYIYDNFGTHINEIKDDVVNNNKIDDEEEGEININKVSHKNLDTIGMKRSRQSLLWLLLSAKEIDPVSKPVQVRYLLDTIDENVHKFPNYASDEDWQWLFREQSPITRLKANVPTSQ